jgi:transcriptional regulator GlxA family with amidase domain
MTENRYFLPRERRCFAIVESVSHLVAILVYPGFELLDASGPASVFNAANRALSRNRKLPFYTVEPVSADGGLVRSNTGVALQTSALSRMRPAKVDTLLIAGAEADDVRAAIAQPAIQRWVPRCAKTAVRFGSVCSGTFILAALGLLDGKSVATHWDACTQLAQLFPCVSVDPEKLYVVDGNIWTSAGVSTGIDMALAMVSRDLDAGIAVEVAKRLVLYARRPGYQSQFSPLLRAQVEADNPFGELISWVQTNLDGSLDVPALAARTGLTERSFYRKFLAATGETPARFVETLRLDAARVLLLQDLSLKVVAARVGLSPAARFTEAFERRFGVTPGLFRDMHASL